MPRKLFTKKLFIISGFVLSLIILLYLYYVPVYLGLWDDYTPEKNILTKECRLRPRGTESYNLLWQFNETCPKYPSPVR